MGWRHDKFAYARNYNLMSSIASFLMTKPLAPARFICLVFLLLLNQALPSPANVRLPGIFGNHMVLQQDAKIPIWGWADAGEAVTVTLGDKTAKTTDANGKWRVDLDPVATATTPLTLTVTGKNSLKFDDVLVGDVWICSGQSNMEFELGGNTSYGGAANAATAVPAANDPQLRLFVVQKKFTIKPETEVVGQWKVCTPDSASSFSAVGYFFGQELRHALNRPIGLIDTSLGGMLLLPITSAAIRESRRITRKPRKTIRQLLRLITNRRNSGEKPLP